MKTVTIKLAAPLQSYGNQAKYNFRTTGRYPSKSAVLGMIGAALGYNKFDSRFTSKIQELNKLLYAVRVEQRGSILTDLQVVEYTRGSKTDKKVTHREYLQDAVFIAAIGSENAAFIDKIEKALHHPKYALFLGRKACPFEGVVETHTFDNSPTDVLLNMPWQAAEWFKKQFHKKEYKTSIYSDAKLLSKKKFYLDKDKIGSFDSKHFYHTYRKVVRINVTLANKYAKAKGFNNTENLDFFEAVSKAKADNVSTNANRENDLDFFEAISKN